MPRNFMFSREEIVSAALDLTREKGFSAVSARSLGEKLGTSSRPIFGRFQNMAEVQAAIIAAANEVYQSYLKKEMSEGKYVKYKASGMAYIRFAKEEKELFKLLFMRDRTNEENPDSPEEIDSLVDIICKQINISREDAYFFHIEMWVYVHGIASMIATGYLNWDEELASRAVTDAYEGIKMRFESKQNQ